MLNISQKLRAQLLKLEQRHLEKGEIFLLAKAIADELPLAPQDTDNIGLFILAQKSNIETVLYEFSLYSYLDEDTVKIIYKLISELSLWRLNVAYDPPVILFRGGESTVIDDISSLPRYVDLTYMCATADIINNANYMYSLFRSFVKEVNSFNKPKGK